MHTQAPSLEAMQAVVERFNLARYGEAEVLLRDLTVRFPQHGFGWKALGPVLNMQGRYAEALAAMQKAVELMPHDAECHSNLGKALKDAGRLAEAEACHRRALEVEPQLALAHNNLGAVLADQGRFEEAEASYRRALEQEPRYAMAHGNLGTALRALGRLTEAEASYRRALELTPDLPEAHSNLGNALRELGRCAEAEASCGRALALQPDYADAHNTLGSALRDQGRLTDAEASYRRALELKPDYAEAHNNLGNALRDQGRLAEAAASYRRAVELMPASVDANVNLSVVLNHLVPAWHVPMMNDTRRNDAYIGALKAAVTAHSEVLEIGTGSGLLAMTAARLGAHHVVTCEAVPTIAAVAHEIVAANGLRSSVNVVAKISTDLEVGVDLPRRANLLVSEILASELLGEGVLSSIEDAKRRLLEPGAAIIPAAGSVVCALFGGDAIRQHIMVDQVAGLDLGRFNSIASQKRLIYRDDLAIELMTEPTAAFEFEFMKCDYFPAERRTLRIPVTAAGRCWGVAQWIRLRLDDSHLYENHPATKSPTSSWQTCLYRFATPVDVRPGQTAVICAAHNRSAVWFFLEGIEG